MTEHGVNTGGNIDGSNTGGNVVRNPDVRVDDSCRCGADVVADTRGTVEDRPVRDRAADCPEPFHAVPGSRQTHIGPSRPTSFRDLGPGDHRSGRPLYCARRRQRGQ